jgi:hypothetical protein
MLRALCERHEAVSGRGQLTEQCRALLDHVDGMLRRQRWEGYEYDAVWSDLHEARHILCGIAGADDLQELVHDARIDAAYVSAGVDRNGFVTQIAELERQLVAPDGEVDEALLRRRLRQLSVYSARSREAIWRRAHRIESHLLSLLPRLVAALAIAVAAVPYFLHEGKGWPGKSLELLLLMGAGVFGSLLHMLRESDATDASGIDFHLRGVRNRVRPALGAAIVLVLYVAVETGILQSPIQLDEGPKRQALALLLAFFAGFLDDSVLGQIERLGMRVTTALTEPAGQPRPGQQQEERKNTTGGTAGAAPPPAPTS